MRKQGQTVLKTAIDRRRVKGHEKKDITFNKGRQIMWEKSKQTFLNMKFSFIRFNRAQKAKG